jgi:membrane-associated phospholipid phosphatase
MSPRIPLLVLAALTLSAPSGAAAQSASPDRAPDHAAQTAGPSPYELTWARDGLLIAGAGTGALLATVLADDGPRLTPEDLAGLSPADVNRFDRPATRRYSTHRLELSQHLRTPLALAPLALLVDSRVRADWLSLGVMYAQTMTLAAAVPGITKATVSRHRPFVYNTDLSTEERLEDAPGRSFFSRTTTTAFASAVFFATVFADHRPDSALRPWVWGGALAAGGTVGYLRFSSGVHYPSDVLVGAAVGTAVGYLVPRMHRRKDQKGEDNLSLRVGPGPEGGITLSGTVRF